MGKVGGLKPPVTGGAAFAADRVLIVDKETGRIFVDDTDLGCTVLARATPTPCAFQGVPVAGADGTLHQPTTQCGAALWPARTTP